MAESSYRPHQWIEAGLLQRGNIKRELAKSGLEFNEVKGFTTSVIQVKCTPDQWDIIHNAIREWNNGRV